MVAGCALRALAGGELIAADNGLLSNSAIPPLAFADREEVMAAWDAALADAHRQGSPYSISGIHIWRGYTHLPARRAARRLRRPRGGRRGVPALRLQLERHVLLCCVPDPCADRAGRARACAGAAGPGVHGALDDRVAGHRHFRNARLELLVAEGRFGTRSRRFDVARRGIEGWVNPIGHRWRSLLALSLVNGNGSGEEAVALVSAELADARAFGAPGHVGRSLRALFEVTGDLEPLREAVSVLEGSTARLELAKALCALGEATRDAAALRRALNLALGGGATPVAARARTALAELGAEPAAPDDDALTGPSAERSPSPATAPPTERSPRRSSSRRSRSPATSPPRAQSSRPFEAPLRGRIGTARPFHSRRRSAASIRGLGGTAPRRGAR